MIEIIKIKKIPNLSVGINKLAGVADERVFILYSLLMMLFYLNLARNVRSPKKRLSLHFIIIIATKINVVAG